MSRRGILKGSCKAAAAHMQAARGIHFSFQDVCHLAGFWLVCSRIGAGFSFVCFQRCSASFRAFQPS